MALALPGADAAASTCGPDAVRKRHENVFRLPSGRLGLLNRPSNLKNEITYNVKINFNKYTVNNMNNGGHVNACYACLTLVDRLHVKS